MARKRTAVHLRSHLSVFEAERYPIQKGYIARLLLVDGNSVPDVVKEVKAIVQTNEPHKELLEGSLKTNLYVFKKKVVRSKDHLTDEWPSLLTLFLEPFRITFRSLSAAPASSQPGHPSVPSPSRHPEPSTSPASEMLLEPDIPVTPTLMQPVQNSTTINSSSCLMTCKLPSPRKLKNDCANCINKQRTIMNMLQKNKCLHQKNKCLHQQSREFQMLLKVEKGNLSLKRLNEWIKRKTQSVTKWKMRYASLSKACRDTHKLLKSVDSLEQQVKTLEGKLIAAQEENSNMASENERLESMLVKMENGDAYLKQVNVQLKSKLEKAEDDNAHLKRYRQAIHSPEMGIKEESTWEDADNCGNFALQNEEIKQEEIYDEHHERSLWTETSISDKNTAISKDVTSNISMKDMLCGEGCQVKAEGDCLDHGPSIYIDNAEVPFEHISTEDVNQTITAEEKVEQLNLFSGNEATSSHTQLYYTNSHADLKENGTHLSIRRTGGSRLPSGSFNTSNQDNS